MPTQNVNLPDRQADFIRRRVAEGRYQNASEVVRAGLRLLEQREREDQLKLRNLRRLVKEGFDQIDRGEYEVVTPDSLDAFMNSVSATDRRSRKA